MKYQTEKMKRFFALFMAIVAIFTLTACKSEAVKDVEAAIGSIGTVSLENGESILIAEHLLEGLSEDEKEKVSNLNALAEAREQYEALAAEKISGQLETGNWVNALTYLETVDEVTIDNIQTSIVSSLVRYLSNFAPKPKEIDVVNAGLGIMELVEAEENETASQVIPVLEGMQEYLSEAVLWQDYKALEEQHNGVIAKCTLQLMDGNYVEKMAAIDFVDTYVSQITYAGTEKNALDFIAALNEIRDGMNTVKTGMNRGDKSLILKGLEQVQEGAKENVELGEQMVAYNEKQIKVLTAASELKME